MQSLIIAIIKTTALERALDQIKEQLCSPMEMIEELCEFKRVSRKKHVGLTIVEYEILRNLEKNELADFFEIDSPLIILARIGNDYYSLPVRHLNRVNTPKEMVPVSLAKIINQNFCPLQPGAQFRSEQEQFITRNLEMQKIYQNARRVAQYKTHVLLLGESGTGKDIIAGIIHRYSNRNSRIMVKVNCAAIPSSLLESEMFGYRKGAFTDAYQDKIGKIQLANGSSLFLDEIGDLNPRLQAKLLRVIETGEVDVIGSVHPVQVDVRLITATNQDLKKAVMDGKFREDLYYRLKVITLQLVPLRKRLEDIPLLFDYFISLFSKKYNKKPLQLSKETLSKIYDYHWPGNVRELRNFVERLVVQNQGTEINEDLLQQEIENLDWQEPSMRSQHRLEAVIMNDEKQHILRTLYKTDYKVLKTAEELGISRISLFRKIKKYNIDVQKLKQRQANQFE